MMNEMMKNCLVEDGKPNFEKIKAFMEDCGCGCFPPLDKSKTDKTDSKKDGESKQGG